MVSEPKAHVIKSKATKRQKEKVDIEQQLVSSQKQPLLSYYMSSTLSGQTSLPSALPTPKRARVEDLDGDLNGTEM